MLDEDLSLQQGVLAVLDERTAFVRPHGEVAIIDLVTAELLARLEVGAGGGGFARASVNAKGTLAALQTDDRGASAVEIYRLSPLSLLARRELPDTVSSAVNERGVSFAGDGSGVVVAGATKTMWVAVSEARPASSA